MTSPTCPTTVWTAEGAVHTIVGCGSSNTRRDDLEPLWDCLDCGIWFDPAQEEASNDV